MNDMTGMASTNGGPPPSPAPAQGGRNPLADHLTKRIAALSPQELQALDTGVSPAAAQVIKKVLPEIAPLIDQVFGAGAGGASPAGQPRPAAASGGGSLLRTI